MCECCTLLLRTYVSSFCAAWITTFLSLPSTWLTVAFLTMSYCLCIVVARVNEVCCKCVHMCHCHLSSDGLEELTSHKRSLTTILSSQGWASELCDTYSWCWIVYVPTLHSLLSICSNLHSCYHVLWMQDSIDCGLSVCAPEGPFVCVIGPSSLDSSMSALQ